MTLLIDNTLELEAIDKHHAQKETIVFTNGCFDILHPGHTRYLAQAKNLGNILVVGLNSDHSVKRLKGATRPINNQNIRKEMLLALKSVDYVCIFDEDNILKLLPQVRPDILVKGGDWSIEKIIGHEFMEEIGGKTISLPFVDGYSSSAIIKQITNTQE